MSLLWLYYGEVGCFAAVVDGFCVRVSDKAYIVRCNIQFYEICLNIDLLYRCSTQIHEVRKFGNRHRDSRLEHIHYLPALVLNISKTQRTHHDQ